MEKDYLDQLKDVLKDVLEKRHLGRLGKEKETVTKMSKIGEWFAVALSLSNNLVSPWTAKIVEIGGWWVVERGRINRCTGWERCHVVSSTGCCGPDDDCGTQGGACRKTHPLL